MNLCYVFDEKGSTYFRCINFLSYTVGTVRYIYEVKIRFRSTDIILRNTCTKRLTGLLHFCMHLERFQG